MAKHTLEEAAAAFDNEALDTMMTRQIVETFPSFADAPDAVREARDRVVRRIGAMDDMTEALAAMVRAWDRFGPGRLVTLKGSPSAYDRAVTALKKAGVE